MKTFLIVFSILILLGIVIFLLIKKPEKVIDDNAIVIPNPDSVTKPGSDEDVDEDVEVHIPEHCKIDKCNEVLPNKYFFHIRKYTSKKGREILCVVCNAIINNKNYRIIVKNSYYPYVASYTPILINKIKSMFENDKMTVEEFTKLGSTNFVGAGEIVEYL